MSSDVPVGPERVDAEKFIGANVMAGTYEDGSVEVRIWSSSPVNPTTAAEEIDHRLLREVRR